MFFHGTTKALKRFLYMLLAALALFVAFSAFGCARSTPEEGHYSWEEPTPEVPEGVPVITINSCRRSGGDVSVEVTLDCDRSAEADVSISAFKLTEAPATAGWCSIYEISAFGD